MDLVTVTCFDDLNQMLLQAESIQKCVNTCTHWVIVNELQPRLDLWQTILEPYYTNHKLNLVSFSDEKYFLQYMSAGGYYSQQVFKLLISKFIKGKYLIVDTKHVFKSPINLNDYSEQHGNGLITDYSKFETVNVNHVTIRVYAKKIGIPVSYLHLDCLCPYVIDGDLLNQDDSLDKLLRWLISLGNSKYQTTFKNPVHVNEYLLYSTLVQKYKPLKEQSLNKRIKSIYLWNNEKFSLIDADQLNECPLIGFHRNWINNCSDEELNLANEWLDKLQFKNKLIRTKQ